MITVTISSCCTRAFITTVNIVRPFILPQWFKAFPSTWIYCPYKPTIIVVTVIFKQKFVSLFEGAFWFFRCLFNDLNVSKVPWKIWCIPTPALFSGYISNQDLSWWLSGLLSYAFPEWKIILRKGLLEYKRFYPTSFFL